MLTRVFDMFVQVNGTAQRRAGRPRHRPDAGAQPRGAARRHGRARSSAGTGTRHRVHRAPAADCIEPRSAGRADAGTPRRARLRPTASWSSTTTAMPPIRWRASCETDGRTHQRRLRRRGGAGEGGGAAAAIAILDIGMPRHGRLRTGAQRFAQDPRHADLALVALTGWGQAQRPRTLASAGFDHHLLKPVDIGELTRALSRLSTKSRVSAPSGRCRCCRPRGW